ncbi:MAG TPA: GNAT family N-acetyltransferase [Anaerolineae bacterium]|nr:GNAT family N-acetyltransferase [Anaerolineae bacterium]
MGTEHRQYRSPDDFMLVGHFLISHFQPGNRDGNWLQPTWEYMHSLPYLDESSLDKIRIWEDSGEIVAVVHYESRLGEVFFQIHPKHTHLKQDMLDYAENHLYGETETGNRFVRAFVNDFDFELETLVKSRGYEMAEQYARPISEFQIPQKFPPVEPPEGFHIKSLADDNDLMKIHRVLWRGFDHSGEPPAEEIEGRKKMQSTPNFRKDLTIVVEAPSGDFVSFCGTWYESVNKIAYVEPVATDPDFRRMGLGKVAVLEGIRRCGALGAAVAFVGSDLDFYKSIGFTKRFDSKCWIKHF